MASISARTRRTSARSSGSAAAASASSRNALLVFGAAARRLLASARRPFVVHRLPSGPYLYDYRLHETIEPLERHLIEIGAIEATGLCYVGERAR
jgi:hypothetical protein